MEISLQGYNSKYVTFLADGEMQPGQLVILSADNTVKKASSGKFAGVVHSLRGGYALIQTGGYAELGYSGTAPTVGFQKLSANETAGVTMSDTGREVLVTSVDVTNKVVCILF